MLESLSEGVGAAMKQQDVSDTQEEAAQAHAAHDLFALHGPAEHDARPRPAPPNVSFPEFLAALHHIPSAYLGSKWSGWIRINVPRSFSVGVQVDGDAANEDVAQKRALDVEAARGGELRGTPVDRQVL